jgi:hypothetical protein
MCVQRPADAANFTRTATASRSVCHCLDSQKRSGSAFAAKARWPDTYVTVTGEAKPWVRTANSGHGH